MRISDWSSTCALPISKTADNTDHFFQASDDPDNPGVGAYVEGINATAAGEASNAIGAGASAYGSGSFALADGATAVGYNSLATGMNRDRKSTRLNSSH